VESAGSGDADRVPTEARADVDAGISERSGRERAIADPRHGDQLARPTDAA